MAISNYSPKVFLAVLSMVVSVVTWSIICYSFVVNCVLVLSIFLSPSGSKSSAVGRDLEHLQDNEFILSAVLIFYSLRLVCEIVSCILLVVQFLSSYEFALSNEENEIAAYEKNWRRCHQNVLFWSLGIFVITLCSALTELSPVLFFEITMSALNLVFLVVVLLFNYLIDKNTSEDGSSSRNTGNLYIENQSFQEFSEKTPAYNILVNSFIDKGKNANEKSNDLNMLV